MFCGSHAMEAFFIVTYLAMDLQTMPITASFSKPDTTTKTSINSYNRSLYNHNAINGTWISTSSNPNCSLLMSAFKNLSHCMEQHNCITPLNEAHGHRHFQDYHLNKTRATVFTCNFSAYLISISDTYISGTVLEHLQKCIEACNQQTLVDIGSATRFFIHNISHDIPQAESCIQHLDAIKPYVEVRSNIFTLNLNICFLESLQSKVKNISTLFINARKYDMGKMALQYFDIYLTQLKSVLQLMKALNTTLNLHNLSLTLDSSFVKYVFTFGKWESELLKAKSRHREVSDVFMKVKALEIFRRYVDPAVYCVIVAVGLVWNGVLLFIFVRHRQLWTSANVMIFNLALADILSIILNVPVFYVVHYHVQYVQTNENMCKFYITFRTLSVAVSALSVAGLSILRYGATTTPFSVPSRERCKMSNRARTVLYILVTWVLAVILALPYSFVLKFTAGKCFTYGDGYTAQMVALLEFMFYSLVLPCIMVLFNVLTAKNLRDSTRNIPSAMQRSGQDLIRNRSAKVLTVLVAVFIVSYIPQHLWRMLYRWFVLDIWDVSYRCIDKITYYMLFANCCFNPISLYVVSRRFRNLFNYYFMYLCNHHCKKNPDSNMPRFPDSFVIDIAKDRKNCNLM